MIVKTTAGLLARDEFDNGSFPFDTANYESLDTLALASGRLRVTSAGGANRAMRRLGIASRAKYCVQILSRVVAGTVKRVGAAAHVSDLASGLDDYIWGGYTEGDATEQARLVEFVDGGGNGANGTALFQTTTIAARATGTDYYSNLFVDGATVVHYDVTAAVTQNLTALVRSSGYAGIGYLQSPNGYDISRAFYATDRYITVPGLPTGATAEVRSAADALLTGPASESGGTATIDALLKGSWTAFAKLLVKDSTGYVLDTYSVTGEIIEPGGVYTYTAPFTSPVAGAAYSVGQNIPVAWNAIAGADSYDLGTAIGGGSVTTLVTGLTATSYEWNTFDVDADIDRLFVREVIGGTPGSWRAGYAFSLAYQQPTAPHIGITAGQIFGATVSIPIIPGTNPSTADDVVHDLEYRFATGGTWYTLATGVTLTGANYDWARSARQAGDEYQVRVRSRVAAISQTGDWVESEVFELRHQYASYWDALVNAGAAVLWKMAEASGAVANDSSGNARHGVIDSGGVTYSQTSMLANTTDTALLGGSGDWVSLAHAGWQYTTEFTITKTERFTAAITDQRLCHKFRYWELRVEGGYLRFRITATGYGEAYWLDNTGYEVTTPMAHGSGVEHTYAVTYSQANGRRLRMYIDGVLAASFVVPANYVAGTGGILAGATGDDNRSQGFAYLPSELSPADIHGLYQRASTTAFPPTVPESIAVSPTPIVADATLTYGASTDPQGDTVYYEAEWWDGSAWATLHAAQTSDEYTWRTRATAGSAGSGRKVRVRATNLVAASDWLESSTFTITHETDAPATPTAEWVWAADRRLGFALSAFTSEAEGARAAQHEWQIYSDAALEDLVLSEAVVDDVGMVHTEPGTDEPTTLALNTDYWCRGRWIDDLGAESGWSPAVRARTTRMAIGASHIVSGGISSSAALGVITGVRTQDHAGNDRHGTVGVCPSVADPAGFLTFEGHAQAPRFPLGKLSDSFAADALGIYLRSVGKVELRVGDSDARKLPNNRTDGLTVDGRPVTPDWGLLLTGYLLALPAPGTRTTLFLLYSAYSGVAGSAIGMLDLYPSGLLRFEWSRLQETIWPSVIAFPGLIVEPGPISIRMSHKLVVPEGDEPEDLGSGSLVRFNGASLFDGTPVIGGDTANNLLVNPNGRHVCWINVGAGGAATRMHFVLGDFAIWWDEDLDVADEEDLPAVESLPNFPTHEQIAATNPALWWRADDPAAPNVPTLAAG